MMEHFRRRLSFLAGFVTYTIALQTARGFSITEKDRYLANYVIRRTSSKDWLSCTYSCHDDAACVSYNYNMDTGSCDLNNHGIQTPFTGTEELMKKQGVVFHQIRPTQKIPLPREVEAAIQCDCSCTSESACRPGEGSYHSLPSSCKEIWEKSRIRVDGSFFIRANSASLAHVFCRMTPIPGCGDGGWTLVMKIDGNKQTFTYDSTYWENAIAYNEYAGTSLKDEETKLSSFWSTPFTRLCMGMKDLERKSDINWVTLKHNGSSLRDVLSNGNYTATNLTVEEWTSLLNNSALIEGCYRQGFNNRMPNEQSISAKARIGIIGGFSGSKKPCSGPAGSRIGFGTGGTWFGMNGSNSCGNEKGRKLSKRAFGYIFVQ